MTPSLQSPAMQETQTLPKTVDPFRFAASGRQLSGKLAVRDMPRLLPDLLSDASEVSVSLEFGVDESIGLPFVKGEIKTCLELRCQRCLETFSYDIIAGFLLGLVRNMEAAERLPERYDPVVVVDGALVLKEVVEDELIVNLPVVPRHPPEVCRVRIPEAEFSAKAKNPFEAIGVLRDQYETNETRTERKERK